MFTLTLIVVAFVGGFVLAKFHTKIGQWLVRRAAANKIAAAQKLIDDEAAAAKALADAKAIIEAAKNQIPPHLIKT